MLKRLGCASHSETAQKPDNHPEIPGVSHTVGEVRTENPALKGSSQEDEMVVGFDALESQKPKGFKGKMTIECPTEFQTIHRNQSKSTIQRSQGSLRLSRLKQAKQASFGFRSDFFWLPSEKCTSRRHP